MRKNRLFILGIFTVMVALVSLSLVSGTWAKYTSTVSGEDTARVAKWAFDGATLAKDGGTGTVTFNLFDTIKDTNLGDESDVAVGTGESIIAPGTSGTVTFELKNTGEVNAKATFTISVENTEEIPVKFYKDSAMTQEVVLTSGNGTVAADVVLNMGTAAQEFTLYWQWAFDGDEITDTNLGIDGDAEIKVTANVVFVQVD